VSGPGGREGDNHRFPYQRRNDTEPWLFPLHPKETQTVRRRRFLVIGTLLAITVLIGGVGGVWWYYRTRLMPFRFVMRGGKSTSGNFSVNGGNIYLVNGRPGVIFSTVTKPDSQEATPFVLVFRHDLSGPDLLREMPFPNFSAPGRGVFGGEWKQTIRNALTIRGKRIEAVYELELNGAKVVRESITVGGESRELAAGRVFLVNLDGELPVYSQKNIDTSALLGAMQSPEDVERFAEAVVRLLKEQDSESRALLP
jgi:hypothetical protein